MGLVDFIAFCLNFEWIVVDIRGKVFKVLFYIDYFIMIYSWHFQSLCIPVYFLQYTPFCDFIIPNHSISYYRSLAIQAECLLIFINLLISFMWMMLDPSQHIQKNSRAIAPSARHKARTIFALAKSTNKNLRPHFIHFITFYYSQHRIIHSSLCKSSKWMFFRQIFWDTFAQKFTSESKMDVLRENEQKCWCRWLSAF